MSAVVTSYGATYFLDVLFGGRQAPPANYWVALLAQAPGAQADGSLLAEPDPNAGYARTLLPSDQLNFAAAATGVIQTSAAIVFPVATADWTTVTHYALCDAQTGGNVYLYGSFATPRKVLNGDVCRIPNGLLHLTVASLSQGMVSTF
jgi:hypothetical protein